MLALLMGDSDLIPGTANGPLSPNRSDTAQLGISSQHSWVWAKKQTVPLIKPNQIQTQDYVLVLIVMGIFLHFNSLRLPSKETCVDASWSHIYTVSSLLPSALFLQVVNARNFRGDRGSIEEP